MNATGTNLLDDAVAPSSVDDVVETASFAVTPQRGINPEFEITCIRTRSDVERFAPTWREFVADSPRGCSFDNEPMQIALRLNLDSSIEPFIVVIKRDSQVQCIAPFYTHNTRFRLDFSVFKWGSLKARILKLFGDDVVIKPNANTLKCLELVFECVFADQRAVDFCLLQDARIDGSLWKYWNIVQHSSRSLSRFVWVQPADRAYRIANCSTFQEYESRLGSKTRQNLRRLTRKLMRDHEVELVRVTEPEQVHSFLGEVDRVFEQSWQARTYGYYSRSNEAQIKLLKGIAEQNWLRSYVLRIDKAPVAFQLGYLYGTCYHAREFGFHREWAESSPGAVLMFLFLQDLLVDGAPNVIDLGVGDSPQKLNFAGVPEEVRSFFLVPNSRWWRGVFTGQSVLRSAEGQLRTALEWLRLDRVVRRFLKRK